MSFGVTTGMKQLFCHVNLDNKPAQELYRKTGFKVWPLKTTLNFFEVCSDGPQIASNSQIASDINVLAG